MALGKLAGGAALALAGTYTATRVADAVIHRREDLDPNAIERPGSMFFIRGTGVHYIEAGSGPPLVLVPGFYGSTFSFAEQIPVLARHFRVLALDLPGFGYSDRPVDIDLSHTARAGWLAEFLDRMGVERATVIGHSMGGAIAMRLAEAHPERVEKLALVAGATPDETNCIPFYRFLRPLMSIPAALVLGNMQELRRPLRRIAYDPAFITDKRWEIYTRPARIRGSAASLIKMMGDVCHDAPLHPSKVATRTLLLWGEADQIVPLAVAHYLHRHLPDARLEVIPRAGHLVLEEQPERANEAILRFLGVAGSATSPARAAAL